MKLTKDAKVQLLGGVERSYQGFFALEMAEKSKIFNDLSLADFTRKMIHEGQTLQSVTIDGQVYNIHLEQQSNGSYQVAINPKDISQIMTFEQAEEPANHKNVVALLASQSIEIDPSKPHPYITIMNENEDYPIRIGGDKMPLYNSHLVTIYRIRERLLAGEDISNLLVALATGSGKTFVQALWLVCLHSAGLKGFFGVPGSLEKQFSGDLEKLLPKDFIEAKVGRLGDPNKTEGFLGQDKDLVIGDEFHALDNHFDQLNQCDPNEVMLSFDEQHLLMRVERRRLRLIDLSERFLSCFLTATPNEETYNLCGKNPVATMSNKQKAAAKQGKIPKIVTTTAESATDKNATTEGFFKRLQRRFNIFISNGIQKQPTNAAVQVLDELPFIQQEVVVNGKVQSQKPVRRKMLFIVDDPDSLINIVYRVTNPESREVYANGNLYSRGAIGDLLQIPDIDSVLYDEEMERRGPQAKNEQQINGHLRASIFHNMVDFLLSKAMGMDLMKLNEYRQKTAPDVFLLHVMLLFGVRAVDSLSPAERNLLEKNQVDLDKITTANYSAKHFENILLNKPYELDLMGAQEISEILKSMGDVIVAKLRANNTSKQQKLSLVLNDASDDLMMAQLLKASPILRSQFDSYAESHLVLGIMDDMHSKDLPIEKDAKGIPKPFWGMTKDTYPLYDSKGTKSDKAKKRPLQAIESLNPQQVESRFVPNYADISESQADQYFKLGFVGMYVSNRKTEGFSDLNLHTVVHVCDNEGQRLNGPDKLLQGLGRNRGLDETVEPMFIHALGNQQKSAFSLKHLNKEDYFKEYFQGMNDFRKPYLKLLGDQLAEQIISEYYENVGKDNSFDQDEFRTIVMKMIREDLREINSLNNHEMKISRKQLGIVLAQANKKINEHVKQIENPNKLSRTTSFLGNLMNAVASLFMWNSQRAVRSQLKQAMKSDSINESDRVYSKILSQTSYKQLAAKGFVGVEISALFAQQSGVILGTIEKSPLYYLDSEQVAQFKTHEAQALKPMLLQFIKGEDDKALAKAALDEHPDLLAFFNKNQALFMELKNPALSDQQVQNIMVRLFAQFELTKNLGESAFVNPIRLGMAYETAFRQGPQALLTNEVTAEIAEGISDSFIQKIKEKMIPLLMPEDQHKLQLGLTHEAGQKFIQEALSGYAKFLRQEPDGININDQKVLFSLLNKHLGANAIQNPEELAQNYSESMSALKDSLEESPVESMNDVKYNELKELFRTKIIPATLSLCSYEERMAINAEITSESLDTLIQKHALTTIFRMQEENQPQEVVANFILSTLTGREIHSALSPDIVIEYVSTNMRAAFAEKQQMTLTNVVTMGTSAGAGFFNSLFWGKGFIADTKASYIQDVFLNEHFLNVFSTLVPIDQYRQLRARLIEPGIAKSIAAQVILLGESPEPDALVNAFSQGSGVHLDYIPHQSDQAQLEINAMLALKDTNPSSLVKKEVIDQLAEPTKKTMISLAAKYIENDVLRNDFLNNCASIPNDKLFDFMVKNEHLLSELNNEDFNQVRTPLVQFFNGLNDLVTAETKLPPFEEAHLRNLALYVEETVSDLETLIELETISEYLRSRQFIDILHLSYNEDDLKQIEGILSDREQRKAIAIQIKAGDANSLDALFNSILIANNKPPVTQLDQRISDYVDFLSNLGSEHEPLKHLDKTKLNDLIKETLLKKLNHPLVVEQIAMTIGLFNEQELTQLVAVIYAPGQPKISAQELLKFYEYLKTNNTEALAQEFLKDTYGHIEELPIVHIFETVAKIHEEMLKVHCTFNQHGMRGELVNERVTSPPSVHPDTIKPKIFDSLSATIQEIKTPVTGTAMEGMSRQISYFASLKNAFPDANTLHGYIHADDVKHFTRIHDHIIEPVRARTGQATILNWLMDTYGDFKRNLASVWNTIANLFRKQTTIDAQNKITSEKEQMKDDRKEAIALAGEINKLEKLSIDEAKRAKSPVEAVDKLVISNPKTPAPKSEEEIVSLVRNSKQGLASPRFFHENVRRDIPVKTPMDQPTVSPAEANSDVDNPPDQPESGPK